MKRKLSLLNKVLIGISISSVALAAFSFLIKRQSSAKVAYIVNGSDYGYEEATSIENPAFWNNYPFFVLPSQSIILDTSVTATSYGSTDKINLATLVSKQKLFYRCFFDNLNSDHFLADLEWLKHHSAEISVLADAPTASKLVANSGMLDSLPSIYILKSNFPTPIDRIKRNYFFSFSRDFKQSNILVSRKELSGIMDLYLREVIRKFNSGSESRRITEH